MAVMEFLSKNQMETTTSFKVESATNSIDNLIDRNKALQYVTDGYDSNTSTVISYEFGTDLVISNIILQNHNFKQFRIFYNSATANVFSTDINTSDNSATSNYYDFNSVTVSSIQLQVDVCTETGVEKQIGQFICVEKELEFERNPSARRFKPLIDRIQVKHKMADGGITLHNIKDKYKAKLKLEFITESFHDSLFDLYDAAQPLYFVPFPTTTAWLGIAHEVVWSGDFNFKYAENVKDVGFTGDITIEETTNA